MDLKTLHQEVRFPASPDRVYTALTDPGEHSAFTGDEAENTNSLTEDFTAFGGYITGRNLELVPGKRIHQTWKALEDRWPKDHFSEVIYNLAPEGYETVLHFTQKDIPADMLETFAAGWEEWYWEPLREYLAGQV